MGQLSFLSAEARQPGVSDLAGLLCGPGQVVGFARGRAARVSVVLADPWRAGVLALACAERGVRADVAITEEGYAAVRTPFRTDLTRLAADWLRGAAKAVPPGFEPDGAVLRLWALASGRWDESGYSLGLDPNAPDTHIPLQTTLTASGLPCTLLVAKGCGPVLKIVGRRRLARLAELVGRAPSGIAERTWPAA